MDDQCEQLDNGASDSDAANNYTHRKMDDQCEQLDNGASDSDAANNYTQTDRRSV